MLFIIIKEPIRTKGFISLGKLPQIYNLIKSINKLPGLGGGGGRYYSTKTSRTAECKRGYLALSTCSLNACKRQAGLQPHSPLLTEDVNRVCACEFSSYI